MARNVSRVKLGYYPLPPAEGARLRGALHQLTEGAEVERYAVELDAGRAAQSAASGITTVHGNLFDAIGKVRELLLSLPGPAI